MRPVEDLIEALEYAADNDTDWWEIFDSKSEAFIVLRKAGQEEVEDYEIAHILSLFDDDDDIFEITPEYVFRKKLAELKKELKQSTS